MFGNSGGRRMLGGGRLIIAAIMIVVALMGYFGSSQVNPVTGQTQHVNMSPQEETAMGLQAAPEMEAQFGGLILQPTGDRTGRSVWATRSGSTAMPREGHTSSSITCWPIPRRSTRLRCQADRSSSPKP